MNKNLENGLKVNKKLAKEMEDYAKAFHKKGPCSPNCRIYPDGTIYCDALINSRYQKFKDKIEKEIGNATELIFER